MSIPARISRNSLDPATTKLVKDFYHNEEVSRQLPGMYDTVTVRVNGKKEKRMKKLLLLSLKEAHILFKEKYPEVKVGSSKFCELRPKEIILPGGSGTHNVCVCVFHQNVKLALDNSGLLKSNPLKLEDPTYKGYLDLMICDDASEKCLLNECKKCKDNKTTGIYEKRILDHLEKSNSGVQIHQWENTDRSNLVVKMLPNDEFVRYLFSKLLKLKTHHYISKKQTKYFTDKRNNLKPGEVLVNMDFSENYNHLVQNQDQAYYWNMTQTTLHPVQINYLENGVLKSKSFAFVSNDLGMLFL